MANSSGLCMVVATLIISTLIISSPSSAVEASGVFNLDWLPLRRSCQGTIVDCMGDKEFDLDSEINRRILADNSVISYEALKRNSIPCSHHGASYYNCKTGAEANPYNRGCSKITRCKS